LIIAEHFSDYMKFDLMNFWWFRLFCAAFCSGSVWLLMNYRMMKYLISYIIWNGAN